MEIIGLVPLKRVGNLATPNPYVAYIHPAWAGNSIVECLIYISDWDLDDYKARIFPSQKEAEETLEEEVFHWLEPE